MADLSFWQFPLSLTVSLAFIAVLYLLWRYLLAGPFRRFLTGRLLCIISLSAVTVLTAIEGTWGMPLHRKPYFWAAAILMMASLFFAVLDDVRHKKGLTPALCHSGMFLLSFGALWGAPDVVDVQVTADKVKGNNVAYTVAGRVVRLPFDIRLDEFNIGYYDDGISPKQFSSVLDVDGKTLVTSVNHPCRYRGYRIYQYSYDEVGGTYSVLKLVRDPWLPLIYIGMLLLAAGALLRLRLDWKSRYLAISVAAMAVLFTVVSVARINFGTLMPALRSWWFVPHLVMYMIAYSSLALALVFNVVQICGVRGDRFGVLPDKLFNTASSLLLLGMLCGAVWAKAAWGDWWTWDTKECWAAVTWLLTLMGSHLPMRMNRRNAAVLVFVILSFLAMQVAWYGVDYLPAAGASLHTYK